MFAFQARALLRFQVAVIQTLRSSESFHPAVNGCTQLDSTVKLQSSDLTHNDPTVSEASPGLILLKGNLCQDPFVWEDQLIDLTIQVQVVNINV